MTETLTEKQRVAVVSSDVAADGLFELHGAAMSAPDKSAAA